MKKLTIFFLFTTFSCSSLASTNQNINLQPIFIFASKVKTVKHSMDDYKEQYPGFNYCYNFYPQLTDHRDGLRTMCLERAGISITSTGTNAIYYECIKKYKEAYEYVCENEKPKRENTRCFEGYNYVSDPNVIWEPKLNCLAK